MKRSLRVSLVAISAVFIAMSSSVETPAQGVLGQILKRMEINYQGLKTLRADVKMDKFNAQLGEHDPLTEGVVTYVPQKGRDAIFRIDWQKPVQESLAVVNKEYVMYRWNSTQAIKGKVSQGQKNAKANNALSFINMSKAQLQANYNIAYLGQENVGAVPTWHLELIPKTANNFKKADLWVDGNGMPIQARVTENNSDTTTILLSNLQKNVSINVAEIPIKLPKKIKIIQG